MKRMTRSALFGIKNIATQVDAGNCEDVFGTNCGEDPETGDETKTCPRCEAIREALDWLWDRIHKYEERHARKEPKR